MRRRLPLHKHDQTPESNAPRLLSQSEEMLNIAPRTCLLKKEPSKNPLQLCILLILTSFLRFEDAFYLSLLCVGFIEIVD